MLPTCSLVRRALHTSVVNAVRRRAGNPGLGHQLAAYESPGQQVTPEEAAEFEDLESDFMDVHKTHREHEQQLMRQRERVRRFMIKHKYFRDAQLPNLVTYAEKEQMRLLHQRNPEEWTPERLAESFPATPEIIRKILDAKWKPRSTERIRRHDEAVIKNWERLRSGSEEVDVPPQLKEHLLKFANRKATDLNVPPESWPTHTELPKPKRTEFLSIITSCSKYSEPQPTESLKLKSGPPPKPAPGRGPHDDDETYLLTKVVDKRKMRLQELKTTKLTPDELAVSVETPTSTAKQAAELLPNPGGTGIVPDARSYMQRFESNEVVISAEDQKRYEITKVKDRIYIPKKVWRKGCLFRVEDCYYDDDGEFLYRVPGMTQ